MRNMTKYCPCCGEDVILDLNDSYDWDKEQKKLEQGILVKWNNRRKQKRRLKRLPEELR